MYPSKFPVNEPFQLPHTDSSPPCLSVTGEKTHPVPIPQGSPTRIRHQAPCYAPLCDTQSLNYNDSKIRATDQADLNFLIKNTYPLYTTVQYYCGQCAVMPPDGQSRIGISGDNTLQRTFSSHVRSTSLVLYPYAYVYLSYCLATYAKTVPPDVNCHLPAPVRSLPRWRSQRRLWRTSTWLLA